MLRTQRLILAFAAVTTTACATTKPRVEFIARPGSRAPFSEAVRAGHILFVSGAVGADSTGKLVPGGIAAETRQALENIKSTLEHNGVSMDRVVKCTAMLADIGEWAAMNAVYVTYFPGPKPARSAFGAGGLVLGARIELECIAVTE